MAKERQSERTEKRTQVETRHKAADSPDSLFTARLFQKDSHLSH